MKLSRKRKILQIFKFHHWNILIYPDLFLRYRLWHLAFPSMEGSETWKNSEPLPLHRLWSLEKFGAPPILALGFCNVKKIWRSMWKTWSYEETWVYSEILHSQGSSFGGFLIGVRDPSQKKNDHISCLHLAPRTSLHLVLCLRPLFEGAAEPGIFSVPESRGTFGIFPSPRTYMEETKEWQLAPSDR